MRRFLLFNLVMFATACGGPPQGAQSPSAVAQDAKRQADRGGPLGVSPETPTSSAPTTLACGDTVLNDQATSGGEQLTRQVPCTPVNAPATRVRPARILDEESREPVPNPPVAPTPADDPPPKR